MDEFYEERKTRAISDLNIVPILDMFISIVFFLLLSTSLLGLTKIFLPPSGVHTITDPLTPPPLNPKMFLKSSSAGVKAILKWEGAKPGASVRELPNNILEDSARLDAIAQMKELVQTYKAQFPNEKTLQVGLDAGMPYQWLISMMDAASDDLPDLILLSYNEAQAIKE